MAPYRVPPGGGTQIGANGVERKGTQSGRGHGESESRQLSLGRGGGVVGAELPAGEADLGAVSTGRGQGAAAWQLRPSFQPGLRERVSRLGAGAGAGALWGFRSDAGGRTLEQR